MMMIMTTIIALLFAYDTFMFKYAQWRFISLFEEVGESIWI